MHIKFLGMQLNMNGCTNCTLRDIKGNYKNVGIQRELRSCMMMFKVKWLNFFLIFIRHTLKSVAVFK